jgi:hypothetical protein
MRTTLMFEKFCGKDHQEDTDKCIHGRRVATGA